MKGSVGNFTNMLIYVLILVSVISALVIIFGGSSIEQNMCIPLQSGIVNNLNLKMNESSERGVPLPYSLDFLNCVKCMWYDKNNEKLVVIYSLRKNFLSAETLMEVPYNITAQFVKIGCNCNDCDEKSGDIYCANLRNGEDSPYQLEINKNSIECMNCKDTFRQC